jgi:hypothetical protein
VKDIIKQFSNTRASAIEGLCKEYIKETGHSTTNLELVETWDGSTCTWSIRTKEGYDPLRKIKIITRCGCSRIMDTMTYNDKLKFIRIPLGSDIRVFKLDEDSLYYDQDYIIYRESF